MRDKKLVLKIFENVHFSDDELQRVLEPFEQVVFKKNDVIFKKSRILNYYYFLQEGFIRSFTHDFGGNEVTTKFYSSEEIVIDWTSFLLRNPTQENFQAISDSLCWRLSYSDFQRLFHSIEKFRESGRSRFARSYLELAESRLSIITTSAKERYLALLDDKPDVIQRASLKHIASYLGVTDTSLSRITKEISR